MKNANINTLLLVGLIIIIMHQRRPVEKSGHMPMTQRKQTIANIPYYNYNTQRVAPFRQVGVLYKNDSNLILPLYGRRTYARSNAWNYYTTTGGDSPIQLEISIQDRECLKKTGCKELYTDDSVYIPEYSGVFTVKLYI
jgi:hypothetical protein